MVTFWPISINECCHWNPKNQNNQHNEKKEASMNEMGHQTFKGTGIQSRKGLNQTNGSKTTDATYVVHPTIGFMTTYIGKQLWKCLKEKAKL